MREIEWRIAEARNRLTEMQQAARQGSVALVMLGLLALAADLVTFARDLAAEQLRRPGA